MSIFFPETLYTIEKRNSPATNLFHEIKTSQLISGQLVHNGNVFIYIVFNIFINKIIKSNSNTITIKTVHLNISRYIQKLTYQAVYSHPLPLKK